MGRAFLMANLLRKNLICGIPGERLKAKNNEGKEKGPNRPSKYPLSPSPTSEDYSMIPPGPEMEKVRSLAEWDAFME